MAKQILCILLFLATLTSCGIFFQTLAERARKLNLGMTKTEVVDVLGKDYIIVAAVQTPEGNMETLKFTARSPEETPYILIFLDNKLVEFYQELPQPSIGHQSSHNRHDNHHIE